MRLILFERASKMRENAKFSVHLAAVESMKYCSWLSRMLSRTQWTIFCGYSIFCIVLNKTAAKWTENLAFSLIFDALSNKINRIYLRWLCQPVQGGGTEFCNAKPCLTPLVQNTHAWRQVNFLFRLKEKWNWITGQNFSQFGENRIENDQKLIFRHFPGSGLFWSFFFTVRGYSNPELAENLYFCLIFYALSNAKNRILLDRLVRAVGRVERNFATPCTPGGVYSWEPYRTPRAPPSDIRS
jgi:hypothetical protein